MSNSKLLLRTNSKLTGNVKICVDDTDNVYLNSIPVNKELSQTYYQKYKVSPVTSRYSSDVCKFFNSHKTQSDIIFESGRKYDDLTVQDKYEKQYEKQYEYGFSKNQNRLYPQQFSLFAPIYLESSIPSKFVIFRIDGALPYEVKITGNIIITGVNYLVKTSGTGYVLHNDKKYYNGDTFIAKNTKVEYSDESVELFINDDSYETKTLLSSKTFYEQFINNSKIAKIFDLSDSTNIGKYLKNHIKDNLYVNSFVDVNYKDDRIGYNGIDLNTGVICQKIESLNSVLGVDDDIIKSDERITNGWERNRMINHKILNIEFLFDDEEAEDYKFYRYYGLYVNDLDLCRFFPDTDTWKISQNYNNPFIGKQEMPINYDKEIIDTDGVKIIPKFESVSEGFIDFKSILESDMLCYVKDSSYNIHKIKNTSCTENTLCLNETSIKLGEFQGFTDNIEEPAVYSNGEGKSSLSLKITADEIEIGDIIKVYLANELIAYVTADDLIDYGDESYTAGESRWYYFYPYGGSVNIAKAIKGALRYALSNYPISVEAVNGNVYLQCKKIGSMGDNYAIDLEVTNGSIKLENDNNGYFIGGTNSANSRVIVNSKSVKNIDKISYVYSTAGYSLVKDVSLYLDEPIYDENGDVSSYDNIDKYRVICINNPNQRIIIGKSGTINIYKFRRLTYGVFDVCDVCDIDFNNNLSDYSKSYTNEYYKYYHAVKLIIGELYFVRRASNDDNPCSIKSNGNIYNENDSFIADSEEYEVISGNPIMIMEKYENDEELIKFIGFNTISRLQNQNLSVLQNDLITNKELVITNGGLLTEYDRLSENKKSYLALKSKIAPNICKWGLRNGKDVRDNPYRLNLSSAFGEINFSPSHINIEQNPVYFTHEWYYLGGIPQAITNDDLNNCYSYTFKPFDKSLIKNESADYFRDYFENDFNYKKSNDDYFIIERPLSRKYSVFEKGDDGNFYTFFRGSRLRLKAKDNTDYTDYKFSSVINFNYTSQFVNKKPFSISLIENRDFKNITMLIEIVVDDYKILPILPSYEGGGQMYTEYIYLYIMNSLKRRESDAYEYGLRYDYPVVSGKTLYLDDPMTTPAVYFRGIQLYNKPDFLQYSSASAFPFGGYKDNISIKDEYQLTLNQLYSKLVGMDENGFFAMTTQNGVLNPTSISVNKQATIQRVSDKELILDNNGLFVISVPSLSSTINLNPYIANAYYPLNGVTWFHEDAGKNVYKYLGKLTSFANIFESINSGKYFESISYKNGVEVSPGYEIGFLTPDKIITSSYNEVDKQLVTKPESPDIQIFEYFNKEVQSTSVFYRYSGSYEPILKSIIKFKSYKDSLRWDNVPNNITWDDVSNDWNNLDLGVSILTKSDDGEWSQEEKSFNDLAVNNDYDKIPLYKEIRDKNIKFFVNVDENVTIKNYWYHKISDVKITSLNNPIYPEIDEFCLASKNVSVIEPSLSPSKYNFYSDKVKNVNIRGEYNTFEDKSFLSGQALKIPKSISSLGHINYVSDSSVSDSSIYTDWYVHYKTDDTSLSMVIMDKLFLSNIIRQNSTENFSKFFRYFLSGIEQEIGINNYILNNAIPYYSHKTISLYLRENPDLNNKINFIENQLTELDLLKSGFTKVQNMNIQTDENKTYISLNLKSLKKYDLALNINFDSLNS